MPNEHFVAAARKNNAARMRIRNAANCMRMRMPSVRHFDFVQVGARRTKIESAGNEADEYAK